MASRFIDELPEKYLEKNSFFDEEKEELEEFEFNQDFDNDDNIKSPGWIRYQKRIK
jgi:DNA helicase-2/ATP-dependent DNA helicase PcrA